MATAGGLIDERAQCVQHNWQLVTHGDHFKQSSFASEQGLCSFSIFDVGVLAVPFHHPAAVVAQWHRPDQEPSKRSVGSSQASLAFTRFTTVEQRAPVIHQWRKVVGVDRGPPAVAARIP
jgi:hypothetical protein